MIIQYECPRCLKDVDASLIKTEFNAKPANVKKYNLKPYHYRLDCLECGRYIKYIGEGELLGLGVNLDEIEFKKSPARRKKIASKHRVTMEELNFKLDLIISHLGI